MFIAGTNKLWNFGSRENCRVSEHLTPLEAVVSTIERPLTTTLEWTFAWTKFKIKLFLKRGSKSHCTL